MHSQVTRLQRFMAEAKELMILAAPIIVSQLSMSGMGFIDTSMAGQASARDLAAIAIGGSLWMPFYLLVRGTLMATTPTVAHLFGAGKTDDIACEVRQGLWIALIAGLVAMIYLHSTEPLLRLMKVSPDLIVITDEYLKALAYGAPAIAIYQTLNAYCEGTSDTRPAMVFSVIALLLNIPANYILIYGKFGFSAMGGVGCGWATALAFWSMAIMMMIYTAFGRKHKPRGIFASIDRPVASRIAEHLKLGFPIGMTMFIEGSIFAIIALLIGRLGASTVASHQVALNFSSLTFMLPLSISFAITIRVGQSLGANNPETARFAAYVGHAVSLFCACLSAGLMLVAPEMIAGIYSRNPAVIQAASALLFYAAIFQFSDAMQAAAVGSLRGYKDTRTPMFLVVMAYWAVGLPMGYILGMTEIAGSPMGPRGFWIGLVAGLTIAALLLGLRLYTTSLNRCRMITPQTA
ncbi:proton-coupled multidrug efflux MATE transporter PmpM [Kistimonas scapharcae]|uniref:Multidrug-efflux transporter n=1 Tax=Kistimonas scapharcae TaxID=1036133 RepID=A0ABP8V3N7_9GAMM